MLDLGARTNEPVDRVALYVDGKAVSRDGKPPYRLSWNTATASEGEHTLLVYARGVRRAAVTVPIVVANAPEFPPTLRAVESSFGVVTPEG
jgi:hypothetical protein